MINKFNSFGELFTLDSKDMSMPYFRANPNRCTSQGFASLCMWEGNRYKIIDGYLCIVSTGWFGQEYHGPYMFPPLSLDGKYDAVKLRELIFNLKDQTCGEGENFTIFGVPEVHLSLYNEAMEGFAVAIPDENDWDYIYDRTDLENLSGRKYAKKRNHLNYFLSNWDYTYEEITPAHVEELTAVTDEFMKRKAETNENDFLVQQEGRIIKRTLPEYEKYGLFGGLIRIDGKVKAFTMASRHTADSVDVCIEKADPAYRGLYQAINKDFAKTLPPEILYINREEDMGLPTLRQTKQSYFPSRMFKVYIYRL